MTLRSKTKITITAPILVALALGGTACFKKRQDSTSSATGGAFGIGNNSSVIDARKLGAESGDSQSSAQGGGKGHGKLAAGGSAGAGASAGGVTVGGTTVGGATVGGALPSISGSISGTSTTGAGNDSATSPAEKTPPAPAPVEQCYSVTFTHKKTPGHSNEEACSHHKNVIKLKQELQLAKLNPKSLCIRVNGTPVPFQINKKNSEEVVIGPIAGPNAKITARFCTGKAKCAEDCTIPKDEFMDAIGGGDESADAGKAGEWGAEGGDKEADVNAHLDSEVKKELENVEATYVFHDWIGEPEAPACTGAKVAKAE